LDWRNGLAKITFIAASHKENFTMSMRELAR
jgi:hypothetical protein